MKKNLLLIGLLAFCFSFVGCEDDDDNDKVLFYTYSITQFDFNSPNDYQHVSNYMKEVGAKLKDEVMYKTKDEAIKKFDEGVNKIDEAELASRMEENGSFTYALQATYLNGQKIIKKKKFMITKN